jgi:Leucine-rich repeat (LRR) protein
MNRSTTVAVIAALFIVFSGAYLTRQEVAVAPSSTDDATKESPKQTTALFTDQIEVYDGVRVASNSTTLDLGGRGLSGSLKAEVRHLTELVELDLSNNSFTGLPAEVGQLTSLQVLDLSNNQLTGLPRELGNLQQLRRLDVRGNAYSAEDMAIIEAALPETTEVLK